jgi:hypothetical protein
LKTILADIAPRQSSKIKSDFHVLGKMNFIKEFRKFSQKYPNILIE